MQTIDHLWTIALATFEEFPKTRNAANDSSLHARATPKL
jgi:hypothetical protein